MRKTVYLVALAALGIALPTLSGLGQEKALEKLMQRKLQASQKVLAGIALNDFEQIADSAQELLMVRRATEWRVIKSPEYELFSNEFQRNAESLERMARTKNLDGAALAYVELTLNCVKCHKYVRETRMTRLD